MASKKIRVISLQTDVTDHASAVEYIAALKGGYVCVATVHMVMEAHDDAEFASRVNAADLVVPDGMPLLWMQRKQGAKEAQRVRGNDLMLALFGYAEKNGLKVGFYGGRDKTLKAIYEGAGKDYPNLKIVYTYSPLFRPLTALEDAAITDDINKAAPDILFVGLGCPKQENWMAEHRDRVGAVMIGVGAAFDFYAGNLKEAPRWMSNIGLEWLFRLAMEPKRLWRRYLILNPRFMWLAMRQLMRKNLYHDTILARNVAFTTEWQETEVPGGFRVERDQQMIGITLNSPYELDLEDFRVKDSNGQTTKPEVSIVSTTGKIYPMKAEHARGTKLVDYRPEDNLPTETEFRAIRLRCDAPFESSSILWTTYNIRDMK